MAIPNYNFKPIQAGPLINLSAKMNDRASNESMDVTPEQINAEGFTFTYLQNGDLFNTKSLSTRLGNQNICNAIIPVSGVPSVVLDLLNNIPPSGSTSNIPLRSADVLSTSGIIGTIIIPSGNFNILNGNILLSQPNVVSIPTNVYGYQLNALIYKTNLKSLPSSGVAFFSGFYGPTSGIIGSIGQGGFYPGSGPAGAPPQLVGGEVVLGASGLNSTPYQILQPEAISNDATFNFNTHLTSSGVITPNELVSFNFSAPYLMTSGNVYFIGIVASTISGVIDSGYETALDSVYVKTSVISGDWSKNTAIGRSDNKVILTPLRIEKNTLKAVNIANPKQQLETSFDQYNTASYILVDKPTSSFAFAAPIPNGGTNGVSETTYSTIDTSSTTPANTQWNGLINEPSIDTTQVEFGEIVYIPSGTWTLYGGYFFANTFSGLNYQTNLPFDTFTRNKAHYPPKNYNAGYAGYVSRILTASGDMSSGNYVVYNRQVLASFSGNNTFTKPYNYSAVGILSGTNAMDHISPYDSDKLYVVYDNPPTISSNGENYLMSFRFYDIASDDTMTDYVSTTSTAGTSTNTSFSSPFLINMQGGGIYSGTFVYNRNNDGLTFKQLQNSPNGGLGISGTQINLSCGLLYLPSGNAITSIYDYRVAENRSQRVIVTEGNSILEAPLNSCNWRNIYSGAVSDNLFKWSHTTYQNQLISHQYSKSSGVVWDQIYLNTSGNSMQLHGLRPSFFVSGVTTSAFNTGVISTVFTPGLGSGVTFSVVLATQLGTGGLRASNIVDYTMPFSGVAQLFGQPLRTSDIFNTGVLGSNGTQYNFDVLPQATYVFATQPSGSLFYLAGLINSSGIPMPNPLPNTNTWNLNGGNGLFINNISATGLVQQIPQVIQYDQQYITDQIDVPLFKKVGVYKDMVIGAGDPNNPSRLWYGQQFTANIFGTDGKFTGFIDIDIGNGSPITAFEIFKDYLIVFKYNSCYRVAYTGDPANPFQVYQLSNTIGCLGFFCTVSTDYGVFGLSQFGPFVATTVGAETIGDEIIPFFETLDRTNLTFSVAIHDRLRQQIYWSITSALDSPNNNEGLIYSYAEKAWNIRVGGMWNAAGIVRDEDNFDMLWTGDSAGQLQQISVQSNEDQIFSDVLFTDSNGVALTKAITLVAETPWLNLGNSMNLKQLRNMRVNCATSTQRIRVDVYFDQNTTKKYTRYINMNAPVINRIASLAGTCRTVKFVLTTVGNPAPVQLNSLQITFQDLGGRSQN